MKGRLTIRSIFEDGGVIDYVTDADVTAADDAIFISYKEDSRNYEETTSKIGISKDVVTLNRFGKYPSTLLFAAGQEHPGVMTVPDGEVHISVNTLSLRVAAKERQINVLLHYETYLEGYVGRCKMDLTCVF